MAQSKRKPSSRSNKSYIVPLFWAVFAVVVVFLFIINMPLIKGNIEKTHLGERILGLPSSGGNSKPAVETEPQTGETIAPEINEDDYPSLEDALLHLNEKIKTETTPAPSEEPEEQPAAKAEERESPIYFMRMDNDGTLVRTQVSRSIKNSQSLLSDSIEALLAGPSAAEKSRGVTSLIPAGTKLVNAAMSGGTAILNFNENFMFNNYGAEGYLAQLRQIVWTATELKPVRNVQFLIDGRRIDFLNENIRVDFPLSRDDLQNP